MKKFYALEGITLNGCPIYVVDVFVGDEETGIWVFDHTEVHCNDKEV